MTVVVCMLLMSVDGQNIGDRVLNQRQEVPCQQLEGRGGRRLRPYHEGDSMRGKRLSAGGSYVPHRALQPPRRARQKLNWKLNWKLNRDAKSWQFPPRMASPEAPRELLASWPVRSTLDAAASSSSSSSSSSGALPQPGNYDADSRCSPSPTGR
jgi:hypothetical protein